MKVNLKGLAGNLIFALDVFIVFLLIFGDKVVIPRWLQPIGRMHPMFLHFPIVLLMLAMMLEYFRFKSVYKTQEFYQSFNTNLLLVGLFTSAITVIMGLFLSHEGGYTGNALQWHKLTGVSIVFITSAIYWSRNSAWYKLPIARSGAILIFFCLIAAGHFGAVLTHGDNFILAPITPEPAKVPVEKAIVFDDVIEPIFQSKCISCHGLDKMKGDLLLTDTPSIIKGGKTGKLLIPGNPQVSLLLQRIHLPEEEKKHMPPHGKTQLTPEEMTLLYLWVKSDAHFKQKVVDLPAGDSLRMLATKVLGSTEKTEEVFDFAAADDKTIQKLSNNYRVISRLAVGSPALSVDFYNKNAYSSKILDELKEIKTQIISVNLNKMPVKDADLRSVALFENLRTLNLDFTEITAKGLKELAGLKHLKSLSLSGTQMDYQGLQPIMAIKSLNKLIVWNTGLKESEIQQLQKSNKRIQIIEGYKNEIPIKLNLPELNNRSSVFSSQLVLDLGHTIRGVKLLYTTDGTEPDSIHSPEFKKGVAIIDKNSVVKVKAYKKGWLSSDVAVFKLYKSTNKPDSISFLTKPGARFLGDGPPTLIDGRFGGVDFNGDEWIGFNKEDMKVLMQFNKPATVSSVILDLMIQPLDNIFLPQSVEIWGGPGKDHLKLLKVVKHPVPVPGDKRTGLALNIRFTPAKVNYLQIVAKPQLIPLWRGAPKPGAKPGNASVFSDEIIVN